MPSTEAFKNLLLDASDIDTLSLHSGDPGADGTANEVSGNGYTRKSCTFAAASGGEKALASAVTFDTPSEQSITHIGMWAGSTFRLSKARTSGDAAANVAGEYTVGTGTKLIQSDV